jgi:hypothetical protein
MQTSRCSTLVIAAHSPAACTGGATIGIANVERSNARLIVTQRI